MGHQEMAVERSKLCRKLLQLRDDSEYQDVTIIASGKHIPAHKCILSVGSVFFNVLLQKCKSSSSGKRTDTVHLANINSDDLLYLEDTINFIYAGEIEISRTNFTSIFRLASYLVVKDLLDLCEMYLRQNLNVENCLQFYLDLCSLTDNSDSHLKLDQEIVSLAREMVEVNFYTAILPGDEILQELKDVTKANIQDDSTQKEILTALDDVENTLTSSLSDRGLNSDVGDVRDSKNTDGKATDIPKETMPTDNNRNVRNETEADDHFTKPSEAADLDKGLESDNVKQNTPTEHLDSGEKLKDGNHINDRSKEPIAVSDNEEYSKDDKEEHSKDDKESTPLKKSDEGSVDLVNICTDDIAGKNLTNDTEDTSKNNPREIAEVVDYHSDSDTDDVEMVESSPQFATQLYTGALSAYRNRTRSAGSLSEHDRTFLDRVNACMKLQPSLTIPKQKRTLASRTPLKSPTIHPKAKKKEQVEFVSKKIKIEPVHDSDDIDAAAENDDSNNETYLNINSIDNTLIQGDMNIKHEQEENQDHRAIAVSTKPKPASTQGAKKRKSVPRKKTLISCDVCGKVFTRRYRLTDHMRSHDGIKKFRCIECGKLFTRNDHVLRHMQKKHFDVEVFTCDVCSDTFRSINEIVSHLAKHLQDDALTEDALLSRFSEKYKERSFAEVKADGGRVYGCKICAKTYNKPYRLRDHLDVHLGIKTDCPECGESFSNKKTMSKHYSNIHAKSENVCTKTFATKYRRDHHFQVVHEGKKKLVKSVICDVCGLSFDIHDNIRPYVCEICAMEFTVKSNMLRHQRRHRGEYHFFCDDCGKGFVANCDLTRHKLTHKPDKAKKKHACKYCGKLFTRASKVQVHERIHTDEQDLMQLAVLTDVGMRIPAFSRDNSAGYTRDQVQAAYGVASDMQQKPEEMIGSTPIKTFNFPNGNY
ncbi:ZN629-like protein [Mya arenaria]|uniref:ZN629-like protein n=1 Tax=Mya arenaria TaxID=6604 RepID=A0ABY7F3G2_MYAAR|nr:ZN629-like protein [Mya arenaria]